MTSARARGSGPADPTFGGTWPFEPRWFDADGGRMHFVDEGPREGRPVILVHGNPTWGYLFRAFIGPLVSSGCRVIVPDHLGFGLSDKPAGSGNYGLDRHIGRLGALLDHLDLREAVVVPHDWGGPISLPWAVRRHERVAGLFILNTLAHDLGGLPAGAISVPWVLRMIRLPGTGELLVQGADAFKPVMFRVAIERTAALTGDVRRAYREVHAGWSDRAGMLAFARQLPTGPGGSVNAVNRETEEGLARWFRDKLARIVWGARDRVLAPELVGDAWLRTLPGAEVVRLPAAGHFVQEDEPDRVVAELADFLGCI